MDIEPLDMEVDPSYWLEQEISDSLSLILE